MSRSDAAEPVGPPSRLVQLLDLVPDAVVSADATTLLVEYANSAAAALVGVTVEEMVGLPVDQVLEVPTGVATVGDEPEALIVDGATTRPTRVITNRSTGEQIPVELHRRAVVRDPDGSLHVLAVARDLRRTQQHDRLVGTTETAFRTAFSQAPIGIKVVRLSPDGTRTMLMVNQAAADMFGAAVGDLIGRDVDDFTLPEDHPGDRAGARAMASGRLTHESRLKRYRRMDGSTVWVEARGTPIELPDVPGPLALVHLVDVTDRQLQRAVEAREASLAERLAGLATAVLAGESYHEVVTRVVTTAREVLEGDAAVLLLGDLPAGRLRVEAASGDIVRHLVGTEVSLGHTPATEDLALSGPVTFTGPPRAVPLPFASALGPMAVAPFGPRANPLSGLLVVARLPGGENFGNHDRRNLARLSSQSTLALHLSRARADQQRLVLLEDRHRIARDLHDGVTQDLIALGMEISAEALSTSDADVRARDLDRVSRLEEVGRQLRRVVFELAPTTRQPLDQALRDLVAESARVLGHRPEVELTGPVESVPIEVADDVLRVAREALSNVARHARATSTRVTLEVDATSLTLTVEDDGAGVPAAPRRGYGLTNMADRATARSGNARLDPVADGGSRLVWSCLLRNGGTETTGSGP